jgi:hypothetical protein
MLNWWKSQCFTLYAIFREALARVPARIVTPSNRVAASYKRLPKNTGAKRISLPVDVDLPARANRTAREKQTVDLG